ncbi:SMC-Scp complex subunit ScpB [Candidatus Woesearchaeota archaeon]|nr:SMC-Scp complex subunit ScpB [Candidatus Woesearchaeota archaeon]
MRDLKKQLEAVLFSVARYISTDELAQLVRKDPQQVKEALLSLMVDLENDPETSLILLNESDQWKLTIRQEYTHLVRAVVTETELSKSILETLAVIAFKYPIKQADLIKIRTNKAYDHLMELEKQGFIIRQRYGRSRLIKLTDKFFEYFDLPREKLKERFKGFESLAKTIEGKEVDLEKAREQQQAMAEQARAESEKERKVIDGEVDLFDKEGKPHKLDTYEEKITEITEEKENLGQLEVVDEDLEPTNVPLEEGEKEQETPAEQPQAAEPPHLKSIDEVLGIPKKEEKKKEEQDENPSGPVQ